eukprot:TRINITY_DN39563_c0_g1_i1.p1 TRINITY_DN39563_c0_g1~~TRINITY_DN39563_c0_g1_i1.p1  ORF type:complete len:656 (+),score=61.41 TRINITY_DN39563_c0_g1_i1:87-2054(+)
MAILGIPVANDAGELWPSEDELLQLAQPPHIPGPSVFDVSPENVNSYNCGSWELVERDICAVLSETHASRVLAVLRSCAVPEAFRTREELVSYKKVMLHVHQRGVDVERQLCQLASFFHEESVPCEGGHSRPTARRGEITDALMQCKGCCEARYDARLLGKVLCNVPRHPAKGRGADTLTQLPLSLRCWKLAVTALNGESSDKDADIATTNNTTPSWHVDTYKALDTQAWPSYVRDFVRAVLICRGADKALRIRDELARAAAALQVCVRCAENALATAVAKPTPLELADQLESIQHCTSDQDSGLADASSKNSKAAMSAAMRRQRHVNLLSGCLPPLRETLKWLNAIDAASTANASRLFVAGDPREKPLTKYGKSKEAPPVFCVPAGFQGGCAPEDYRFKQALEKYAPQMRSELALNGWPAHICRRSGGNDCENDVTTTAAKAPVSSTKSAPDCVVCNRRFASLWVRKSVCYECEGTAKADGRCPFNRSCKTEWFCTHEKACLKCDEHSCDECRFSRGDGEHVRQVAAEVKPSRICLDFDRTLATTRSGGMPIVGKDSIDMELHNLLWEWRDACCIVTRNSHVKEIETFLAAQGAPGGIPIHSLKRPRSKAEFVLPGLGDSDRILFVDDTLAELMDTSISDDKRVYRVLFVRGLL